MAARCGDVSLIRDGSRLRDGKPAVWISSEPEAARRLRQATGLLAQRFGGPG